MLTSSLKKKGRDLQKAIAEKVRLYFHLQEDDVVSRPMGSGGCDLMLSPVAQEKFHFAVEAKNTKNAPSLAALEQAKYNAKEGQFPVVVWKPPRVGFDKCIYFMDEATFFELARRSYKYSKLDKKLTEELEGNAE